tara:strand:- start:112 stop:942 length:831 start_codon:yes stop_codon:yes gene_type:complete
MDYTNNTNKHLLWELLQDSGIFNDMQNNKYNKIQEVFEKTIDNIQVQYSDLNLTEKNKKTIELLIPIINDEKHKSSEPPLTVIYKADDLRKEREDTLNDKMKEHQQMFDDTINPTRPSDINFSDNNVDKPIGSDMDKIIANMMADREKELEIPDQNVSQASNWINNNESTPKRIDHTNADKKVSFKDTPNPIVSNILDKLKTKTTDPIVIDDMKTISDVVSVNNTNNIASDETNETNETNENRMNKLENRFYDFTIRQENIEKMCVQILEIVTKNT